ncbi:DUF262 domain-containing protein [candidate division WOR-3 bacterium]|nr:DUF262 domain-containing protein [candidate division WOR-3 bacterium]
MSQRESEARDQSIVRKTVNDLRLDAGGNPERYFIPAYQRGYRWAPLQVGQLLEDILEFTKRVDPQQDEYYCLQPLVLKRRAEGGFEVVDGQQRLTTLLLVLRYFNKRMKEEFRLPLFKVDYETRPGLLDFLDDPTDDRAGQNIDFFHLKQAIDAIETWFSNKQSIVEKIKDALLNETEVIWYEVSETENPVDVFTRLNVGKIPLTNDELIRALFLKRRRGDKSEAESQQLRIAYEWDYFEKSLQADAFWYFVTNRRGERQNRIGILFETLADAEGIPSEFRSDPYSVFFVFSRKLSTPGATREAEWLKIKELFQLLQEWFSDRVLFHMVGYLLNEGMSISEVHNLYDGCLKSAFERRLRERIFYMATRKEWKDGSSEQEIRERVAEKLEEVDYDSRLRVMSMLLLFNLATLLQDSRSNLRFQFDSYKRENWNIEHIRSVVTDKPGVPDRRSKWLEPCLGYFETTGTEPELRSRIRAFLDLPFKERARSETFDPLYDAVLTAFNESADEVADNSIANLALLDEHTNKSYGNAVFAIKRQRILELDRAGIYVPLCTRNVFLKCYSTNIDNLMFWSKEDRENYLTAITDTLADFFSRRAGGAA